MGLGTNSDGTLSLQLPLGPATDGYKTYLYVNIIDNDGGTTTYQFPSPVVVNQSANLLQTVTDQLLNPTGGGNIVEALYNGDSQLTTQTLLTISSVLNSVNTSAYNTVGSVVDRLADRI
jgi:hypothetical protein